MKITKIIIKTLIKRSRIITTDITELHTEVHMNIFTNNNKMVNNNNNNNKMMMKEIIKMAK